MVNEEFPVVTVIGAGLAGCEAALQLAARGVPVRLIEMRPERSTPVHKTGDVAELVCSNSFKSVDPETAAGSLKYELSVLGSKLLACAFDTRVAAGGALAVDRNEFSAAVQRLIDATPNIEFVREECTSIPEGPAIIATGRSLPMHLPPSLPSSSVLKVLRSTTRQPPSSRPIRLTAASCSPSRVMTRAVRQTILTPPSPRRSTRPSSTSSLRRDVSSRRTSSVASSSRRASRSRKSRAPARRALAWCPQAGRAHRPAYGRRPWAAVQLRARTPRQRHIISVGFQTNLRFGEQERVFRMIPGLENAEFSRYGVMHRNTFVDTPHVLTKTLAMPSRPEVHLAGQHTGTEGYLEAVASGLFVALAVYAELAGLAEPVLPRESLFGCLLAYATNPATADYQPMHVNYGIIDPIEPKIRNKRERKAAYAARAHAAIDAFVDDRADLFERAFVS